MYIANPIYDVVFKFMMEDNRVAKAFLSAIIQEEVLELDFASQERTIRLKDGQQKPEPETTQHTVCRFDFTARIALPGGRHKTVLIELQKAKLASDIMRFRRYLGLHYQDANNTYGDENNRKARQIYCIFLLGHDIDIPGHPVIQVDARTKDVVTNEEVMASNEFIESLHHRSWIVQIKELKQRRRNDLEKLLSIFDQTNRTQSHHILNVNEDDFPESCRSVIRRLRMATESRKIQMEMEDEDDYYEEVREKERLIAQKEKVIDEQRIALDEQRITLDEQRIALEEQRIALEKQRIALGEKDRELEELKKQIAENTSEEK
ncbi:MAG: hypothetical protein LBH90_08410 [Tannerella sp.]|jgi:hypothetical protein|nr:hypothetical protein [Tannerella sp.]